VVDSFYGEGFFVFGFEGFHGHGFSHMFRRLCGFLKSIRQLRIYIYVVLFVKKFLTSLYRGEAPIWANGVCFGF